MTSLKLLYVSAAPLGKELVIAVRSRMERLGADLKLIQGAFFPHTYTYTHT